MGLSDLISTLEAWLTYINVQLLGLKPAHLNAVKTPLIVLGAATVVWSVLVRSSSERIIQLQSWISNRSSRNLVMIVSGSFTCGVFYLSWEQFSTFTAESYDLAIFSNTIWHTAHGNWFYDSVKNEHYLGDHFGPSLAVLAPLYRLWESAVWLLLVQCVALGMGAIACGLLAQRVTQSVPAVLVVLLLYVSNPYLHSVAALDFHPIALAIPLFLWMLYWLDIGRYWPAIVLAGLALLVEESLAPGLVAVGAYLVLFRPGYRWTGLMFAVVGTGWFLLEVNVLLPYFSKHALIHWDRYENLGPDFPSALRNLLTHPWLILTESLFKDHKYYYFSAFLFSTGFLSLFSWREATMIILPALMMLLSHNGGHYKLGFHYSAAILPFLFYSSITGLAALRVMIGTRFGGWVCSPRVQLAALMALLTLNVYLVKWSRLTGVDPNRVSAIYDVIAAIPRDASVRAEGNVVAMLSSRHRIAPIVNEVEDNFGWWVPEYVLVDLRHVKDNAREWKSRHALVESLTRERHYNLVRERDGVLLFHLVSADAPPSVRSAVD